MKARYLFTFLLFALVSILSMSFEIGCNKISNGRYKVTFQTKGYDDYDLVISGNQYTKVLKDGNSKTGKIEWIDDCTMILADSAQSIKEPLEQTLEAGLGQPCILLLRKKGNVVYFKTSRTANLNIVINEGKFVKQK